MVVLRIMDDHGYALDDYALLLLGKGDSPDALPKGFFADRQRNKRDLGTLTYYLNYDAMVDGLPIVYAGNVLRPAQPVAHELGFRVDPRPGEGFVHYLSAQLEAQRSTLLDFLRPNETVLIDIVMRRIVRAGTFTLTKDRKAADFTKAPPGDPIAST